MLDCNDSILMVSQSKRFSEGVARGGTLHYMDYQFTDEESPNGLSAWECDEHIKVKASCEPVAGVYRQQALNRLFAKRVLQTKPSQVFIVGVNGASIDLIRVADLMGVRAIVLMDTPPAVLSDAGDRSWLEACINKAARRYTLNAELKEAWKGFECSVWEEKIPILSHKGSRLTFEYGIYEFCLRDHPLLMAMQENDVEHFLSCERVLDLGCGAGLFLQLLKERGVDAYGVERNESVAYYGCDTGLEIVCQDALEHLRTTKDEVDGIYCSHFVEHLPIEAVEKLIELVADRLKRGGIAVLTFPDPESIRSQLLGFWRDPEHVRFYHPELITTMASVYGLDCEWSSYHDQAHNIYPFPEEPEALPGDSLSSKPKMAKRSLWQKILFKLGVVNSYDLENIKALEDKLSYQQSVIDNLSKRTEQLWNINQTWSWNDNVTLRFKKR
ncbi:class I SAM-dependent methyltransferase [uncultured Pseudoteredinibacter sp.]|uniref:class I SAM-dependent methyltransferase n=1 Tax=uncultured Pseudoteredinibacter sp. TaxID=1641701 RepID=UPI00262A0690|nr:class I SAM-dependent methyltransferase [uncultured Pseudoteredinibacter sp.]